MLVEPITQPLWKSTVAEAASTKLRSSKYLSNLIEQDHRGVKQRVAVMLGFKEFRNAAITIAGIWLLHRIRKGQLGLRVWAFKASLRLRSGTPCWGLEVSTAQKRSVFARDGIFASEPLRRCLPQTKDGFFSNV